MVGRPKSPSRPKAQSSEPDAAQRSEKTKPKGVRPDPDEKLARYVLSPRVDRLFEKPKSPVRMIIEINMDAVEHAEEGKRRVEKLLHAVKVAAKNIQPLDRAYQYVFARLTKEQAHDLVRLDDEQAEGQPSKRAIRRIWPDEPLTPYINRSIRTVKADACHVAFGAEGDGIVWAVIDSGIEGDHPHFEAHGNLVLPEGLKHRNFLEGGDDTEALTDAFGHGTHVAGVLAGETCPNEKRPVFRLGKHRDERQTVHTRVDPVGTKLRGVAPRCKIMSLKVIDEKGKGFASSLIAALEYVAGVNGDGRNLRVHGVNLSLGYPFDAEWYAAGHSPLCTVVDRLSKDGVVVVAASGNDGSTFIQPEGGDATRRVGVDQSINDPGNAQEAITVGATHAEAPHTYGVSYFSSRGPTADGRAKPDLVAPGERILSCAAIASQKFRDEIADADHALVKGAAYFREESGTSMAAPHVSGAAAALMSVKPEIKGNSAAVKETLILSCTDLKRKTDFQGAGLLDLLRAIQLN